MKVEESRRKGKCVIDFSQEGTWRLIDTFLTFSAKIIV